jgi:regulator of protease activity HflC (stomatin/prohibitin superfamily)
MTRIFTFGMATSQIAQTTLRAVLGQSSLDELLSSRDVINQKLQPEMTTSSVIGT